MSYCRFQNTLTDLRDCANALEDMSMEGVNPKERLSSEEYRAMKSMLEICNDIAESGYDEED